MFETESNLLGLTARQFVVLGTIDTMEGACQQDVAARTGIDRSTMAAIMKRLVKRKLIVRRRSRYDARAYVLKVSEEGKHLLAKGRDVMLATDGALQTALSVHEVESFISMLQRVAAPLRS